MDIQITFTKKQTDDSTKKFLKELSKIEPILHIRTKDSKDLYFKVKSNANRIST